MTEVWKLVVGYEDINELTQSEFENLEEIFV